jgi:hypothetical protein
MSLDTPTNSNMVVFDTRQRMNNHERDMVAFIIGREGFYGCGAQYAEAARAVLKHLDWYDENIVPVEDDEGCEHISGIWPTAGRFAFGESYDDTPEVRATLTGIAAVSKNPSFESVAILVDEFPPADVLAEMIDRAQQFCALKGFTYAGHRLLKPQYKDKTVQYVAGHLELND